MAETDRARWDAKHAAMAAEGVPDEPPRLLAAVEAFLPSRGRALDVACGRGGGAVWLAKRGLDVAAVDFSPVALAEARRLAEEAGVAARVRTVLRDLEDDGLPPDLGRFELVLCCHFHAPPLWPALREALAPGGVLAMETPTTRNVELALRAPSPRYLIEPGAILDAAAGIEGLLHVEDVFDGKHVARLVARRPA